MWISDYFGGIYSSGYSFLWIGLVFFGLILYYIFRYRSYIVAIIGIFMYLTGSVLSMEVIIDVANKVKDIFRFASIIPVISGAMMILMTFNMIFKVSIKKEDAKDNL